MAKPVTNWSNNDVKNVTSFTPATKNSVTWTNNAVKSVTSFTTTTKNSDQWSVNAHAPQSYQYDDPIIPYDSPLYQFDYMVNNNTDNQREVTTWTDNT